MLRRSCSTVVHLLYITIPYPFASITRIRFNGYNLSPLLWGTPLR